MGSSFKVLIHQYGMCPRKQLMIPLLGYILIVLTLLGYLRPLTPIALLTNTQQFSNGFSKNTLSHINQALIPQGRLGECDILSCCDKCDDASHSVTLLSHESKNYYLQNTSFELVNSSEMEQENKSEKGTFVRLRTFICVGVVVVIALIAVGLLAHFLTKSNCDRSNAETSEDGFPSIDESSPERITDLRLPKNVIPRDYRLRLQPFFDNFTYSGTVNIELECLEDTDSIKLHALALTLDKEYLQLLTKDHKNVDIVSYDYDSDREFFVFKLKDELKASKLYNFKLKFHGKLNEDSRGFYRSKIAPEKWLALSNFAPTYARKAFPCFDEPSMKANFTLTMVRPKRYISLANMPRRSVNQDTRNSSYEVDEFFTSPSMCPGILAFAVVIDFSHKSSRSNRGVEFQTFSRADLLQQTTFGSELAPKSNDFFEDLFGLPNGLSKIDQIALPQLVSAGFDTWGLIMYQESWLLYDPTVSTLRDKRNTALIVTHEIAHQWFGNLVPFEWWDCIWLSEGFATYMADIALDHFFEKWKPLYFYVTEIQNVFGQDSLKTSQPISVNVETTSDIFQLYQPFVYVKGNALIRMMHSFLGDAVFKAGTRTYLDERKYKTAVQDDLLRHMTQAAKTVNPIDVKVIMDSWTLQIGVPVITVARSDSGQSMVVTQKRFFLVPEDSDSDSSESTKWEIPLSFTTQLNPDFQNTQPQKWIHKTEKSIILTQQEDGIGSADDWIIFNKQLTGYYRVNYQNENWEKLSTQLKRDHKVIHVINRAQLIDDAFNLARAGELDYGLALNLALYLKRETDFLPWNVAKNVFGYIDSMLSRTEIYGLWLTYVSKLVERNYNAIGFNYISNEEDNFVNQEKQELFVSEACKVNIDHCVDTSVSLYKGWIANITSIAPNLRETVLCKAIEKGNIKEWTSIWQKYLASNVETGKRMLIRVLGCTVEPWILTKMLNMTLAPGQSIRAQHAYEVIYAIGKNKVGRYLAFNFMRENAKELYTLYPGGNSFIALVKSCMQNLNTPFELIQLKEFSDTHFSILKDKLKSILELIAKTEVNISWMKRNYEKIKNWLEVEIGSKNK